MSERKFASTGDRTHNHQVMSPTRLPLSHMGGAHWKENGNLKYIGPVFSRSYMSASTILRVIDVELLQKYKN